MKLTKENLKFIKNFTRNLPVFQRRYQEGSRKGQFIFETTRMRGDKAEARGFIKDAMGKPLQRDLYYHVPSAHVLSNPYTHFINTIKKTQVEVNPVNLDKIYREYLAEYDAVQKQLLDIELSVKQETT